MIDEKHYEIVTETGCWIWLGTVTDTGYGVLRKDGKQRKAHRVSYEQWRGSIPAGKCVCHRCDTRLCINPDHLFLGSIGDNNRDMCMKGRQVRGVRNGFSKLNDDQVREIRKLGEYGFTFVEIGKQFGISGRHASFVVHRQAWGHV